MRQSLQVLWGLVNTQQLIVYQALIDHPIAQQALIFQYYMVDLTSMNKFDFLGRDISNSIYNFTETESLNANFRAFDLEGGNFMLLAGSIPTCIIIAVAAWILFRMVSFCTVRNYKKKECR